MFLENKSIKKYLERIKHNSISGSYADSFEIFDDLIAVTGKRPPYQMLDEVLTFLSEDCGLIIKSKNELLAQEYEDELVDKEDNLPEDSSNDSTAQEPSSDISNGIEAGNSFACICDNKGYDSLTNEELIRLYKIKHDNGAKNHLITRNINLVKKAAYQKKNFSSLEYDDLVQEGTIGLIYGIEKFKIEYDTKFSTYVYYWITQVIDRAICDKGSLVRLPVHLVNKMNKLIRLDGQSILSGKEKIPEEICDSMGINMDEYLILENYIQNFKTFASLNKYIGDDGSENDSELMDFIPNSSKLLSDDELPDEEIESEIINQQLKDDIESVLHTLSEREEKIIRLRFGIDDGISRTLEEVGKIFNVTRERIRQIEAKALRKLRHPSRSRRLKDYYGE